MGGGVRGKGGVGGGEMGEGGVLAADNWIDRFHMALGDIRYVFVEDFVYLLLLLFFFSVCFYLLIYYVSFCVHHHYHRGGPSNPLEMSGGQLKKMIQRYSTLIELAQDFVYTAKTYVILF